MNDALATYRLALNYANNGQTASARRLAKTSKKEGCPVDLLEGLERLCSAKDALAKSQIEEFWGQSLTESVLSDYREGRAKTVILDS